MNDPPVHIGQAEVAARITIGKLLVVQPQQVENRCVQVVDVDLVHHGPETEVIRFAMRDAAAHAARTVAGIDRPTIAVIAMRQRTVGAVEARPLRRGLPRRFTSARSTAHTSSLEFRPGHASRIHDDPLRFKPVVAAEDQQGRDRLGDSFRAGDTAVSGEQRV